MKNLYPTVLRRISSTSLVLLMFVPGIIQQAHAAPGTLAQVPLYVGPQVDPNLVFVTDDSGSMDWGVITSEAEGLFHLQGLPYYYTHPAPGNLFHWVVASEEYLEENHGLTPVQSGVWRARTHHYNTAYYNPDITYTPWFGLDKNGNPFTDADPAAALVNPYDPDDGTIDLTDTNTSFSTDHPLTGGITVTGFNPARYYTWEDSNGNGIVDVTDDHELVEITDPVELQNFANWFSYHRDRDLIAKNAATRAIVDITGARIGFATLNNNDDVRIPVASMNLDPEEGNKQALFDRIYQTRSEGGTPLRRALERTGRYYEVGVNSNTIMGVSSPILPEDDGGTCQKNFAVLMTDGYWNGSTPGISSSNADGNDNTDFDGSPFGDDHHYTLADVAMHYYERDLAPGLVNDVPPLEDPREQARHQHMITHTVGFGVTGTLDPETSDPWDDGFDWPNAYAGNAQKVDDLWHAAFNGRGQYFNASDPLSLGTGLKTIFESVTRGRSTSASVAFNTTRLGTDSMLYQASFNPGEEWSGDLVAIGLDIQGLLTTQAWSAAEQLDQAIPGDRTILTWNDEEQGGVPFSELSDLSDRQTADLNTGPGGTTDALGQARLDYLRGDRSNEGASGLGFRVRASVLGDIVYANPVYVGRPELAYEDEVDPDDPESLGAYSTFRTNNADRTPVIYVGANDGMLHGFRASDGESSEAGDVVLSYVPNRLFSDQTGEGLHYLTDPAYSHRYYTDLSPTVSDIKVNDSWRTILIGGYRAGGRGLFALDITDPNSFSEDNAEDIVMWEFTDEDDDSLGHSFSKPTIVQLEDESWAAVFGNGYNDLGDGEAKLYILYLDAGLDGVWGNNDFEVITTGVGTTGNRNGLSTPALVDSDGNGRADRAYAGDLHGNLWAFDLTGGGSVAYSQGGTLKPLFNAAAGGVAQPITSKPVVARNPAATGNNIDPNILVFFGTGQYIVDGDKTSTDTQTFYGVWDNGPNANQLPYDRGDLQAQTLSGASTASLRVTTDHTVNYSNTYGWYFDLPDVGERVVVDPRVRGNFVFFNTLVPDPGACNAQGFGWLMTLDLAHGRSPETPVFDVNNDGEVNSSDLVDGSHPPSGVRMDGIPAGSNFLSDVMYTPDDSGNIDIRKVDTGIAVESGRMSWREVRQ